MGTILTDKQKIQPVEKNAPVSSSWKEKARSLLLSWELYPLLLLTVILRLYNIDKAVFDDDEASVFRMAHDAIVHGLWPLTSNRASLGNLNPPLVVYFFMLPASLSANPLWGNVMVALFNIVAVLLTYLFVRRYYGRLTGTIAAFLYATSIGALTFSRNIWPQNFVPCFAIILIWLLFRGVVERRQGWFLPAVVVIGMLYQFHGSSLLLLVPFLMACCLAFKTIRLREIGYAVVAGVVLFSPYLYWEYRSQFSDLAFLLAPSKRGTTLDHQALGFYRFFLSPLLKNPYSEPLAKSFDNHIIIPNASSILSTTFLRHLKSWFQLDEIMAAVLLLGGMITSTVSVLLPGRVGSSKEFTDASKWGRLVQWWRTLLASPYRQGLLLLLLWQVVPLLLLMRHSIELFAHYFLFLLPGPFILMALGATKALELLRIPSFKWHKIGYYGISLIITLVILTQLVGSTIAWIDLGQGHFSDVQIYPYYNNITSLQSALKEADSQARQHHIHRIYAVTSFSIDTSMKYLAEQIQTPISLMMSGRCLMLPSVEAGPAIYLVDPNDVLADTMLNLSTQAKLLEEPARLAGSPFKLYLLTAKSVPESPSSSRYTQALQPLSSQAQQLPNATGKRGWITTHWRIVDTHLPAVRTTYGFHFRFQSDSSKGRLDDFSCDPTSTWSGDQLLVFEHSFQNNAMPTHLTAEVAVFTTGPQVLEAGPLTMTTFNTHRSNQQPLQTAQGNSDVTFTVMTTAHSGPNLSPH